MSKNTQSVRIGRNQSCPCGSGKKAKRCCLPGIKALGQLPSPIRTQAIVAGILGYWPTVKQPVVKVATPGEKIPDAIRERFEALMTEQKRKIPTTAQDRMEIACEDA